MSGLDWFALSTGVIGLVADFVTIASLIRLDGSYHKTPAVIWLIAPILILYTTIVLSFYTRRIAVVRHLETNGLLSHEMVDRIENGGMMSAKAIGIPLLLLYGVYLILYLFNDTAYPTGGFIMMFLFFGAGGAWWLTDILGAVAGAIYSALDPTYVVAEGKK
jgi:hypothetical protein